MSNPFQGLSKELEDELRSQLEALIGGPSFQAVDLTQQPGGAPDGMNYLGMYDMGLDHIVEYHANALREEPVEPVKSAQDTLNRIATSGFGIDEIGGLLVAAVDRLARLEAEVPVAEGDSAIAGVVHQSDTETNDSVQ